MRSLPKISVLLLCVSLGACASAQPSSEDAQMSLSLSAQGKALLAANKNEEALDVYLSAVSRNDLNARAWNGLGVTYDLLGKREKARESYLQALTLIPGDMTVANNLAHLALAEGDPEEAVKLLEPFANTKAAPAALNQNYAAALKLAKERKDKTTETESVYADLGSYPTEGLAQGYLAKAKKLIDDESVVLRVETEVKVGGGTPVFSVRATGADPKVICDNLAPKAFPCIPKGKK